MTLLFGQLCLCDQLAVRPVVIDISIRLTRCRRATATGAITLGISSDCIYAAGDNAGLQIIDVSDPLNPVVAANCDAGDPIVGIAVAGDRVWVCDNNAPMQVFDISSPLSPELVGAYANVDFGGIYPSGVAACGDYAYLASPGFGILVYEAAQGLVDTTPPWISGGSVDRTQAAAGDKLCLSVGVTDDVGVAGVTANGIPLQYSDADGWTGELTAAADLGVHRIRIVAVDGAGNTSSDNT